MQKLNYEMKSLASLAVFRGLYDSKKDIYEMIAEFIKEVITKNGLHSFTTTEITSLINESFEFSIPEAIIQTTLRRYSELYKREKHQYSVNKIKYVTSSTGFIEEYNLIQSSNELILEKLFEFIEQEKQITLDNSEKKKITDSFCSYLLMEASNSIYIEFITSFIVNNKSNEDVIRRLNTIKEGVILYSGIKYSSGIDELGNWNTTLILYLETEILFHAFGLNGLIFKNYFNDFFKLVKEINEKSNKNIEKDLIELRYLSDVKDDVENFFKKAIYIFEGKDHIDPTKTAMVSILNGCQSQSDILEGKSKFYNFLRINKIKEDTNTDYYSEENHKYNIEDAEDINDIASNLEIKNPQIALKYLNYINILRKGINHSRFENIKYILLSGNTSTLSLAWNKIINPNGNIPLATDLGFITNKLWFKLNKGFGENNYPKSFDIVTRSQIVLSSKISSSVTRQFDELVSKLKDKKMSMDEVEYILADLKCSVMKPEEITEENIEEVLEIIKLPSIEAKIREQSLLKSKVKIVSEENEQLKQQVEKEQEEKKSFMINSTKENEKKIKEAELIASRNERKEKFW